jgi:protein gp37
MSTTKIEWTETTWNPITGCTKLSEGCAHCYAERMAYRLQAMGQENYRNGFETTWHEHLFEQPLQWKKPRMIFVNSMSDIFHDAVPEKVIIKLFNIMNCADQRKRSKIGDRKTCLVL